MTSNATDDEKLIVVEDGRMTGTAPRERPRHLGLCPVRGLEVEDDEVGEVCSVFVLTAKDEQLVAVV